MDTKDYIRHQQATLDAIRLEFQAIQTGEIEKSEPVRLASAKSGVTENLPDEILSIQKRKTEAFSEMNRLHAQLKLLATDEDRRLSAIRIIQLDQDISDCWSALDSYKATGKIPTIFTDAKSEEIKDELEGLTDIQLVKKRNTARAYVSKFKDREDKTEAVASRQALIDRIETRIG